MRKLFSNKKSSPKVEIKPKPQHVAIIMDGNGRWAKQQGKNRIVGHKKGVQSVKSAIKSCLQHEISYLTLFAFSSENWNRPQTEVNALMELFTSALESQARKLHENGVRLQLIGDLSKFSKRIQKLAASAEQLTKNNNKLVLSVAVNYGGRWEIAEACKKLAHKVELGELKAEQITEHLIQENLATSAIPDPDLFIRTSGEYRISNFLLWQAAYAEFYFTDILWPDFGEDEFTDALLQYTSRERRFGKTVEQLDLKETVKGEKVVKEKSIKHAKA